MAKRPRIAVVGSANVDLTTFSDQFPKPGETIFGQRFDLGFGGKSANQAVAPPVCGAAVVAVALRRRTLFGTSTSNDLVRFCFGCAHLLAVSSGARRRASTF